MIPKMACLIALGSFLSTVYGAPKPKPNIIVVLTDDISARELPIYNSNKWSPPEGGSTSDPKYRASTPVLDKMAKEGAYVETVWSASVCSPSRAMVMTGRYAHLHKWWGNGYLGKYRDPADRKEKTIPLYVSSPRTIAHIAKEGGYDSIWAGKTQMKGADIGKFGFDEGCFTAGGEGLNKNDENPNTQFELAVKNGKLTNLDTGNPVGADKISQYPQKSWYWKTSVSTMKKVGGRYKYSWWPSSPADKAKYSVTTYGPDVELDFIFDFMERKVAESKPFFVYHASHLGHDGFDFLRDGSKSKWPGTPKVSWNGKKKKYTRTTPRITRNRDGTYNTHGTVTESGIHTHIEYLDYQMSLYLAKLKELGIRDNTLVLFTSDNGSSGFGKNSPIGQQGTHVPFIAYGPGLGFTKRGRQDVLLNMADLLPTIAEIAGVDIPCDYTINGKSFWPFLTTNAPAHRDWIYGYVKDKQMIRDQQVMIDGINTVYDVRTTPRDLHSFRVLSTVLNRRITGDAALDRSKSRLAGMLREFSVAKNGKNGLPDPAVNGNGKTCSGRGPATRPRMPRKGITVVFQTKGMRPTTIARNLALSAPLTFTISNIPVGTNTPVNVRIYRSDVDVTTGEHTAYSHFTIDSTKPDVSNAVLRTVTQKTGQFITRTVTIRRLLRNAGARPIAKGAKYNVMLRFAKADSSGAGLDFSGEGIQAEPLTKTAHVIFKLVTLRGRL